MNMKNFQSFHNEGYAIINTSLYLKIIKPFVSEDELYTIVYELSRDASETLSENLTKRTDIGHIISEKLIEAIEL